MKKLSILTLSVLLLPPLAALHAAEPAPVEFTVKLETVMKHDDGKFLWFHPRAAAILGRGKGGPAVIKEQSCAIGTVEKWLANCKLIYKMQSNG